MRKRHCQRCGTTTLHSKKEKATILGRKIKLQNPGKRWYCVDCVGKTMTKLYSQNPEATAKATGVKSWHEENVGRPVVNEMS